MAEYDEPRASVPERESMLPLGAQDRNIGELHEVIDLLVDKLRPVTTPARPSVEKAMAVETKAEQEQSPVVETLRSNNLAISRATRRLQNLLSDIEV